MSGTAITELLRQLHTALERTPSLGEQDREQLAQLARDIQALLAQPDDAANQSTTERLRDAIVRFEVTHPDVTGVLASVSKALSDMGI